MEVIDEIAYFNPPSLNSKFNPMCGMRDVLQNSRFYDATNTKFLKLKKKYKVCKALISWENPKAIQYPVTAD